MPQNNDLPVLSILTFPHNWNQGKLEFSVLLLPRGNPLQHLGQTTAPFAGTRVELAAAVIQGLAGLPVPDNPDTVRFALRAKLPSNPRKFFDKLTGMATIVQRTPRPTAGLSIKKNLPGSYTKAFPFERARTNTEDGGEYACRLRTARKPAPANLNPPKELSWGEMLSYVLRQPELARNLGLVYDLELAPTGAHALSLLLASGGWLYVDLDRRDDSHPWSRLGAGQVRCYAARVPALSDARPLFAPVLFPVVSTAGNSALFDEVFDEAINYNDGFGRIVHCAQPLSLNAATGAGEVPAATEAGIQIGWDDEQVVTWYNRQLAIQAHKADAPEAPLGVAGYRVDVRPEGGAWRSLTVVTPHATLGDLGVHKPYEMWIQPAPVRLEAESSEYWFPRYFAQWRGGSLVARDEIAAKMSRHPDDPAVNAPNIRPAFPTLPLRYGQKYTFRVRLADLTGGGPALQDAPHNPATAHEVGLHLPPQCATESAARHHGSPSTRSRLRAGRAGVDTHRGPPPLARLPGVHLRGHRCE